MKFGVPEHIYMNKGVGLKYRADSSYSLNCIYDAVRDRDAQLKVDEDYTPAWSRYSDTPIAYIRVKRNDEEMNMYVAFEQKGYTPQVEVVVRTYYTLAEGFSIPISIHYPVAYAITKKERSNPRNGDKMMDLEFYDSEDNLVLALAQDSGWGFRFRAGRFALVKNQLKSKKNKKDFDGGCLYCDKAVYEKIDGIVYLRCTKYDGKVKETEYMGMEYPEYCKRR